MKIGLYNDSFPPTIDGVANTVFNYAKYITQNHGTAVVFTPKYPNVVDNYPFDVYRYPSISVSKIPYRAGNPFMPTTMHDVLKKEIDIMHVHSPFSSSLLSSYQNKLYPKKKQLPVVFTYHTKFDIDINKFVHNKKLKKFVNNFILHNIKKADEVWAVTEGAGKWLKGTGYQGDYIVMPNGTDFEKGKVSIEEIKEINRIYKIDDNKLVFLFVGRMMWYKNIKLILDALANLKKDGLVFHTFMVGEGVDRVAIESYVKANDLDDYITFTGAIYDRQKIKAFFSRADLFLFPSTYDTSGLVVKEAAACDCASLLIKDSCACENIVDGVSGLLAEENPDSVAKVIYDASQQQGFLEKIGICAGKTVYLPWEDAVAKAYHRYEKVLENHNKNKTSGKI